MDKQRVIQQLQNKYPGKKIICLPEDNPKEIICELGPIEGGSCAIAVIEASDMHYHLRTTEKYHVIKGELLVETDSTDKAGCINLTPRRLSEGETLTIYPGTIHCATGNETWVEVDAFPAWTPNDHYVVDEETTDIIEGSVSESAQITPSMGLKCYTTHCPPGVAARNPAADTVRTYEKVGLGVFAFGTAALVIPSALTMLELLGDLSVSTIFDGLLLSICSMALLFVAAFINIPIMIYQHARFLSRRGAITLGILLGSALNFAVAVVYLGLLILANIHM